MEKIKFTYILKLIATGVIVSGVTAGIVMKLALHLGAITLPDFSGMPLEKAQKQASRMGFDLKVEDHIPSPVVPKGSIISQNIKPRAQIKKGRAVYVMVSSGSKTVTVPDLANMTKSKAVVFLKNSDLEAGTDAAIYSSIYKEDTIIAQAPPAGAQLQANLGVNTLKSLGPGKPGYVMPDCKGKNITDIYKALARRNIFVKSLEVVDSEELESGTITGQSPDAGYKINEDSAITLTISKKPSDLSLKKRLIKIYYTFEGRDDNNAKLIRINVFSLNGSETVYSEMTEPGKSIGANAAVIGDAIVQVFLGTELLKETVYKAGDK